MAKLSELNRKGALTILPKYNLDLHSSVTVEKLEAIEDKFGSGDHSDGCEINSFFGKDVYVRELFIPKNSFIIGRIQKYDIVSIMLQGEMISWTEETGVTKICAPSIMETKAGVKRAAYTMTDVRFVTAHGTANIPEWDIHASDEEIKELLAFKRVSEFIAFIESKQAPIPFESQSLIEMW
jgi:hypothetical protein